MINIRLFQRTNHLFSTLISSQHLRFYSRTCCQCKKYKYALDQKLNVSTAKFVSRPNRKEKIVDGKRITFFSFGNNNYDPQCYRPDKPQESPKRKVYVDLVHNAVQSLLVSPNTPKEIQESPVEIVHVEVSPTLTTANVIWKLSDNQESPYTKDEVIAFFKKYQRELRVLLPTHTFSTNIPVVRYIYDDITAKQQEMDGLFELVNKQNEEYLSKTPSKIPLKEEKE